MMSSLLRLLVLAALLVNASSNQPQGRKILIRNLSGRRLEVNWINPTTNERSLMTAPDILFGTEFHMDSFVTHKFELREVPHSKTKQCLVPNQCRTGFFTVSANEKQVITVEKDFTVIHEDHETVAQSQAVKLLSQCREQAVGQVEAGSVGLSSVLDDALQCFKDSITGELREIGEEIIFQTLVRRQMGEHYENYTCWDFDLPTSPSIRNTTWYHSRSRRKYKVQVLLDRPASRIHLVENFVTEKECAAIEEVANPNLRVGVVDDGKGGFGPSDHRRAKQAAISVPWDQEWRGNPIASASRKVYDYVNHVLGMGIDQEGQERLMSIQYKGRGMNETRPDQYKPHCDGTCQGDQHLVGGRVATMISYCTVPTKGGATNFRNAGIHVNAVKGNAVFFSYIDPETKMMDNGFTEHSGCPVVEGEKKIVTQWVRHGVTKEVPWNRYNSLGRLIKYTTELPKDGSWWADVKAKMDRMKELGYDL